MYFQFRVNASDQGIPPLAASSAAPVTINVIRNNNIPQISNLPATVRINETLSSGSTIFKVDATDDDSTAPFNVLQFSVGGDDNAPQYFRVNSRGNVSVQNRLTDAPGDETVYKVSSVICVYVYVYMDVSK